MLVQIKGLVYTGKTTNAIKLLKDGQRVSVISRDGDFIKKYRELYSIGKAATVEKLVQTTKLNFRDAIISDLEHDFDVMIFDCCLPRQNEASLKQLEELFPNKMIIVIENAIRTAL